MNDSTTPDLSVIKDSDLKRKLREARERFKMDAVFAVEAREIVAEQQQRNAVKAARASEVAEMPRGRQRRALTQDHFLSEMPQAGDIRHLHSVLAVCGLPYDRLPIEQREFTRSQGNMGIMVQAGATMGAEGEWIHHPLPFGPKARLILMHLCSEAIRQKSPKVEIAETFTAFVREMGFSDSGGKKGPLTAFRDQLNALATCSIRISSNMPSQPKQKQFFPFEDIDVWLSSDPAQPSLWPSTVTFSSTMFESLQRHALPVNANAVKAFQGSARKLDLYFWLGWRMHNINEPLHISWEAITEQFGEEFKRPRKFREVFARDVSHLKEVFPKLPLELTKEGLVLLPSGPETLALPPARTRPKK